MTAQRMLVVDDDWEVGHLPTGRPDRATHPHLTALDAVQTMRQAPCGVPPLIFSDIANPEGSSTPVSSHLRSPRRLRNAPGCWK